METIWQMLEQYRILLNDVYVSPQIFAFFSIILLSAFVIRLIILLNYQDAKNEEKGEELGRDDQIYICGHVMLEALVGFIVCYAVVKLTLANPESYIINYIIAPAIGVIVGWWFDNAVIIKLEKAGDGLFTGSLKEDKKDKKDDDKSGIANNITINVNSDGSVSTSNTKPSLALFPPLLSKITSQEEVKHLDKAEIPKDELNDTIINNINEIKDVQADHTNRIISNTEALDVLSTDVNTLKGDIDILRESAMNDKKIELKIMIYECLAKGFATPLENDKISSCYTSYRKLKGNGEIEMLYTDHYKDLPIHPDRRTDDQPYSGKEKRSTKPKCEYGEFDEQCKESVKKKYNKPVE